MKSDVYDTNMIWEFYLKYIVKNIKDLESVQFKTPQHDIIFVSYTSLFIIILKIWMIINY